MAEAMARKGMTKYGKKIPTMQANYEAAREIAITGYEKVGFKRTRVEAYRRAWDFMPANYKEKVTTGVERKWARKWLYAMFEEATARSAASALGL